VEQREVLATASLGYILHSSSIARDALRTWLAERGVMIPPDVGYRAEVVEADQEGRPDVVGAVGDKRYLILEGKFWASLTDAQPVSYLQGLEDGGCLLVVTPELRFERSAPKSFAGANEQGSRSPIRRPLCAAVSHRSPTAGHSEW
jgi:hypothetical protein